MKDKSKCLMTLVMLTIFVVMVGMATQFTSQARFMPLVVGIPGILLCLFQLYLHLRSSEARKTATPADTQNEFERAQQTVSKLVGKQMEFDMAQEQLAVVVEELPQDGEHRREFALWASFIALVAGVILFGFWPTIPVFVLLFVRYFAEKSWTFALGLALIGTMVLYLVFEKGLGALLHGGFLTELILERFTDN